MLFVNYFNVKFETQDVNFELFLFKTTRIFLFIKYIMTILHIYYRFIVIYKTINKINFSLFYIIIFYKSIAFYFYKCYNIINEYVNNLTH